MESNKARNQVAEFKLTVEYMRSRKMDQIKMQAQSEEWKQAALYQKRLQAKYPLLDGATISLLEDIERMQESYENNSHLAELRAGRQCGTILAICDNHPHILLTKSIHPRRKKGYMKAVEGCTLVPLWVNGKYLSWTRSDATRHISAQSVFACKRRIEQRRQKLDQETANSPSKKDVEDETVSLQAATTLKVLSDPSFISDEAKSILNDIERGSCILDVFQEVKLNVYLGSQEYSHATNKRKLPKVDISPPINGPDDPMSSDTLLTDSEGSPRFRGRSGTPDVLGEQQKKRKRGVDAVHEVPARRRRGRKGKQSGAVRGATKSASQPASMKEGTFRFQEAEAIPYQGSKLETAPVQNPDPSQASPSTASIKTGRAKKAKAKSRICQKCVTCGAVADYEWRNQEGPERNLCQNPDCRRTRDKPYGPKKQVTTKKSAIKTRGST